MTNSKLTEQYAAAEMTAPDEKKPWLKPTVKEPSFVRKFLRGRRDRAARRSSGFTIADISYGPPTPLWWQIPVKPKATVTTEEANAVPVRPLAAKLPIFELNAGDLAWAMRWSRQHYDRLHREEFLFLTEILERLHAGNTTRAAPEKLTGALCAAAGQPGAEMILQMVLKAGADANAEVGKALVYAFLRHQIGNMRVLLGAGANPFFITSDLLDPARNFAPQDVIKFIHDAQRHAHKARVASTGYLIP